MDIEERTKGGSTLLHRAAEVGSFFISAIFLLTEERILGLLMETGTPPWIEQTTEESGMTMRVLRK